VVFVFICLYLTLTFFDLVNIIIVRKGQNRKYSFGLSDLIIGVYFSPVGIFLSFSDACSFFLRFSQI